MITRSEDSADAENITVHAGAVVGHVLDRTDILIGIIVDIDLLGDGESGRRDPSRHLQD
jgi:hypothetical protein